MFWEITGVSFVTGSTCSAFFGLVDMCEMKVYFAIAEVCQFCSLRVKDDRLFVTAEAKIVVLNMKRRSGDRDFSGS
jgi:hypothetical protein